MTTYVTKFGALDNFEKGTIDIVDDDPKHYVFSNMFEVASMSKPLAFSFAKFCGWILKTMNAEAPEPSRVKVEQAV